MISYQIIQQDAQLKQLCEQARHYSVVALDTEFERVRSYYAKLGLIQLYFGADVALIDLSPSPIGSLLLRCLPMPTC